MRLSFSVLGFYFTEEQAQGAWEHCQVDIRWTLEQKWHRLITIELAAFADQM